MGLNSVRNTVVCTTNYKNAKPKVSLTKSRNQDSKQIKIKVHKILNNKGMYCTYKTCFN